MSNLRVVDDTEIENFSVSDALDRSRFTATDARDRDNFTVKEIDVVFGQLNFDFRVGEFSVGAAILTQVQ